MVEVQKKLNDVIQGDVACDSATLRAHSKDTSIFEVMPKIVVFPKDANDVKEVVQFVNRYKDEYPELSITARAAGSDMTGGPLNESIILSCTRYMHAGTFNAKDMTIAVEPGLYYRDLEHSILPRGVFLPSYPASKSLCALGGMVMNNSGGERSLRYGQTRKFVRGLRMVLSDGNEYDVVPLSRDELEVKMARDTFEADLYRKTFALLEKHYELIRAAKPKTSKNSAGYALWDVWNRDTNVFDLTQLFTGSQGTLGVMTRAKLSVIKEKPYRRLIALFFKSWDDLPEVVNRLLPFDPESLETFDDATLKLGIRFMPEIARKVGVSLLSFLFKFLPEALISIRMGAFPKLIVLVELSEDTHGEIERKTKGVIEVLSGIPVLHRVLLKESDAKKYWTMRRESFALLRKHVSKKRTVPFIDDFCVLPERMPEFLPKALRILESHGIKANIAGHAGSGNYHIIPLMDLTDTDIRNTIPVVADSFYHLVHEYGGTITAEHNDGIIRTPYLEEMFGSEVYALFREVKKIFDPRGIFNPGKKVGGSKEYGKRHISITQ